ncbi:MAG: glycine zipper domain-containing protein [Chitinophagaceae bacterium]
MKKILIVATIPFMFAACKSNKKTDMTGTNSSVISVEPAEVKNLPEGTKRVTVVESHNADGSKTVTTTTDLNNTSKPVAKATKVSESSKVSPAPAASTVPAPAPVPVKREGWSSRAKGAVIGGVGGAATGVIISKDKVKGGIIGGAIGAGGGYIIGNEIDRNKAKQ